MNPLRHKLAMILSNAAKKGLNTLEADSVYAKELKELDVDNILREDINKLCEEISMLEITRTFSLYTQLRTARKEEKERVKKELKDIAQNVIERAEKKSVRFKTPERYRDLILSL